MKNLIIIGVSLFVTGCTFSYSADFSVGVGDYTIIKTSELEEEKQPEVIE